MPSADKRARKKENARAAREQREAALKRKRQFRSAMTAGVVVVIFVGVIVLVNVAGGSKKKAGTTTTSGVTTTSAPVVLPAGCVKTVPPKSTKPTYKSAPAMTIDPTKTYVAHFTSTCGPFDITLDAKDAPKTVNSFVFLAKNHFFDGLTFHRVAKDFVIQGGDPKGDGSGGPGYTLSTEAPKNGYKQGSVAMGNTGAPDSTGSQFFIVLTSSGAKNLGGPPYLYSALGTVTKGFANVQKLGSLYNKDQTNDPSTQHTSVPLYMFKVTITES